MLCIFRGQNAGTRADAEMAALFPPAAPAPGAQVLIGAARIGLNGVTLNQSVQGVTIRMDGSWTANIVAVEEVIDLDDEDAAEEAGVPGHAPPAEEVVVLDDAEVEDMPAGGAAEPAGPAPTAG